MLTSHIASWSWNGSHPSGEVAEKKTEGDLAITSSRGNTIKAPGSPNNPAVHLARSGNDVVKKQSDLDVESKGDGLSAKSKEKAEKSKADEDKTLHVNGDVGGKDEKAKTGDKRKATEEPASEGDDAAAPDAKKIRGRPKKDASAVSTPKATPKAKKADGEKKKPGRKAGAEKKEKEPKAPKEKEKPAKEPVADGEKKGRGRPKKDGSASTPKPKSDKPKKEAKAKAKPVAGSIGTRTRGSK